MSELKAEQIQTVPVQNVATSLYGKAAGVQIQQTAMGPTGGTKIQIRGFNSVEGNTRPLIVVDGIPINDTDSQWSGRERNEIQQGSALNDINPDDIETMSILKVQSGSPLRFACYQRCDRHYNQTRQCRKRTGYPGQHFLYV